MGWLAHSDPVQSWLIGRDQPGLNWSRIRGDKSFGFREVNGRADYTKAMKARSKGPMCLPGTPMGDLESAKQPWGTPREDSLQPALIENAAGLRCGKQRFPASRGRHIARSRFSVIRWRKPMGGRRGHEKGEMLYGSPTYDLAVRKRLRALEKEFCDGKPRAGFRAGIEPGTRRTTDSPRGMDHWTISSRPGSC